MSFRRWLNTIFLGLVLLAGALPALAAGPSWMPGFPMRMGTNVMLMWTPVPGAAAYNVYKSEKQGELGPLLIGAPANNYMDANIPLDKSVYYTVKAVTDGAEGEGSTVGQIVGIKPLTAPKWIGHMEADGHVAVRFDQVAGAAFYNIFRAEAKAGPFALVGSIQEAKYTDSKVTEGNSYYYQVSAVDKNNVESPRSEIYEYKFEKKVVSQSVKTYEKVEQMVKAQSAMYGPDERPIAQPTWLQLDGRDLILDDGRGIFVLGLPDGNFVREYKEPANYGKPWGRSRAISIAADGTLLTTWFEPNVVRGLTRDSAVAFEFPVQKPTKEEYSAAGRDVDWQEDQKFDPVPQGIAEDPSGRLWVCEPVFAQIHVYERDGTLVKKIGEPRLRTGAPSAMGGPTLIKFHKPTNRMYVLDPTIQYVRAFDVATMDFIKDAEGKPVYGWKRAGGVPGGFQEPRGITLTKAGDLIITDGIDGRIQIFTPELEYKSQLVTKAGENKPSGMGSPMDIAVDGDTVYVAEPLAGKVSVYTLQ